MDRLILVACRGPRNNLSGGRKGRRQIKNWDILDVSGDLFFRPTAQLLQSKILLVSRNVDLDLDCWSNKNPLLTYI